MFQPGQSGNPKGRPPGRGRVAELQLAIEAQASGIIDKLIKTALSGDVQAAKLLLDRCLPTMRPIDTPASLPPGITLSDLNSAPAAILAALAAGTMTPDQAGTIASALGALVRVREFTELVERIERLETRANDRNP